MVIHPRPKRGRCILAKLGEKEVLKRFFEDDGMSEMVNMLRDDMENPKVAEIVLNTDVGMKSIIMME